MNARRVFALVPAAGQSRRMGQPKQFLPYGDSTILETVIQSVLDSTVDGLVVVGNPQVRAFLADRLPDRCHLALNEHSRSEMIESVQIGLARVEAEFAPRSHDGIMLLLCDQPQVGAGIITTCAESYRLPRKIPGILIATYGGRRGHPAIFSHAVIREIAAWSHQRRLSELAQERPEAVRELPITTTGPPVDVNTPEDYRKLSPNT